MEPIFNVGVIYNYHSRSIFSNLGNIIIHHICCRIKLQFFAYIHIYIYSSLLIYVFVFPTQIFLVKYSPHIIPHLPYCFLSCKIGVICIIVPYFLKNCFSVYDTFLVTNYLICHVLSSSEQLFQHYRRRKIFRQNYLLVSFGRLHIFACHSFSFKLSR